MGAVYSVVMPEELEKLESGAVRRRAKVQTGLFIDGTGLDRATRRLEKRVDYAKLIKGLISGRELTVSRYYCLIPHEDDSRQVAYLDAVKRAGLEVITKRMPPKGAKRQVAVDVPIAVDLLGFAFGQFGLAENSEQSKQLAIVVCPSREVVYALEKCDYLGVEITLADFGGYAGPDSWKGVDNWIDLSTSTEIWR